MKQIEVVRGGSLKTGYSTPGIVREKAFESMHRYIVVSRTRVLAGKNVWLASPWNTSPVRLYGGWSHAV